MTGSANEKYQSIWDQTERKLKTLQQIVLRLQDSASSEFQAPNVLILLRESQLSNLH